MKKYICFLAVMLLFTACGSDDDDNKKDEPKVDTLTPQKLTGLWVADYAQSATDDGLSWTRVVEDFLFRGDGTGYWECFLLDGNQLVGAEADRDNGALHYTISGNTITVTLDATGEKRTLTYADGKLTDAEHIVFQRATAAQQAEVEQWYADWQGMNSGTMDDGTTIKTDVSDSYTDEPARARKR
jgi:hypothetical protein